MDDIYKQKYLKYTYKRKLLEDQIGGLVNNQCENLNTDKSKIALFDLAELATIAPVTVNEYDRYIDIKKQYSNKGKCMEKFSQKINELHQTKKKTPPSDIPKIETQIGKLNADKTNTCNFMDNYNSKKNTNLINDFLNDTYTQMTEIQNIYTNALTITCANSNYILFNIIGSYLNLKCDDTFLNDVINTVRTNNKCIYIIDFMNFCSVINDTKKSSENLYDLIFIFLQTKLTNGDTIIIVFKGGCMKERDLNDGILNNHLHDYLNRTLHIITAVGAGNIDDFIFWICGTYFFNRLNYLGKSDNLFLLTEDKQSLSETGISVNVKNLLNFTKGFLSTKKNPNQIKCFNYKSSTNTITNNENCIVTDYFNVFDSLISVRSIDLLTLHQLSNLILKPETGLLSHLKKYDTVTSNIIKELIENFVSPGIIFYTLVKYVQFSKYKDYNGSINRNAMYEICKNPNLKYIYNKNTKSWINSSA